MYWGKKFKFTKREKKEFKEKMSKIRIFCETNNITTDEYYNDAYYFEINGQPYCVSNTIAARSDLLCRLFTGEPVDMDDIILIHAGKTRIIDIYNDLKAGYKLDKHGRRIIDTEK